ncbi:MAG: 30S ribosomal protein S9 [Candidatus Zixiibacteriota bacterium]|nr:MAG: 30S ribosomal protein S9 [candidate division Zixibacteria bacterium]
MADGQFAATGRRKNSVARVTLKNGSGTIIVNGKDLKSYLCRDTLVIHALKPLDAAELMGKIDVKCDVGGGGLTGQAGAIRLGIARALTEYDPELRGLLKKNGLLTRDPRMVERKKYGLVKARKRFQFSKR